MDVEFMNLILDAIFGPDQGANIPATVDLELWAGDPRAGGTELSYPGYAAVSMSTSSGWTTAASGGVKQRDTAVTFPDATDEADDVGTHWAMRLTTGELGPVGLLGERLDISEAGTGPTIRPRVRVADALTLAV